MNIHYFILNALFLVPVAWMFYISAKPVRQRMLIVAAILICLTAIFDNVMIANGIFAYNPERILGIYLGRAPIEDFAYAVAAAIAVPWLWERFKR